MTQEWRVQRAQSLCNMCIKARTHIIRIGPF
jgi:hypothetical protein